MPGPTGQRQVSVAEGVTQSGRWCSPPLLPVWAKGKAGVSAHAQPKSLRCNGVSPRRGSPARQSCRWAARVCPDRPFLAGRQSSILKSQSQNTKCPACWHCPKGGDVAVGKVVVQCSADALLKQGIGLRQR